MRSSPRDTGDVVLRAAQSADVTSLVGLEAALFQFERLRAVDFKKAIVNPQSDLIVADFDGRIAGYALASYRRGSSAGWLDSIGVATWASGRGIGSALIAQIEQMALARGRSAMRLYVRTDNAAARSLYERLGYRQTSRKAEFYADFCDALRLQHILG
jgi:ribosomal protein S18 acetylase RimI-like enzyme